MAAQSKPELMYELADDEFYLLVQDRIDRLVSQISAGNCGHYDEYRELCGEIKGLRWAHDCLKDAQMKERR